MTQDRQIVFKNIIGSKVMLVLVKSWKNATKPHGQGSKTNESACIKLNSHLFA